MKTRLRCMAIAVLLAVVAPAAAQAPPRSAAPAEDITHGQPPADVSQLQFTAEQRSAILNAVRPDSAKVTSPIKFVVSVGAPVPPSLELYLLPDTVLTQIPVAKVLKFTVVENQIVLVDPTTMRVVDFISL